jgi:hypothetical protein
MVGDPTYSLMCDSPGCHGLLHQHRNPRLWPATRPCACPA